jgi:hypothetical protein
MTRAVLTIASNPRDASTEDAYNAWYSGPHLQDIREAPGVVAARRLRAADHQLVPGGESPQRYLLVCELEVDDLETAIAELAARAAAPEAAELMELDPMPVITVWEAIEP